MWRDGGRRRQRGVAYHWPMTMPGFRVRRRMVGRDKDEAGRVSSPLELLFDLTFVVAVAQVASELAKTITDGTALELGIGPYLMVFFAIWWAWVNFTWFASAYDTDDVPYRLFTMLQMGGVLVLAAGVPAAFDEQNFVVVTVGYVIMRTAGVSQWIRAGIESPAGRTTALRYASGVTLVQLGWVARLLLPVELSVASFVVLALADLSVPVWAERGGMTPWHPYHIAERYGLFTIILLGECVSAATIAVRASITDSGVSTNLAIVAVSGLVLLFSLWWLYFARPAGPGLAHRRQQSFAWGYAHYFLFAAIAAVGAGIEVSVESSSHQGAVSSASTAFALAVPVAVVFVMLYVLHSSIMGRATIRLFGISVATVVALLMPLAAGAIGIPLTVAAIAIDAAALTAFTIFDNQRMPRAEPSVKSE